MPRCLALIALLVLGSTAAQAYDCSPYCDFVHDYGPQDFSYIRPGLYLFPRCDPSGACSPYLISSQPRRPIGRVIVRSRSAPRR